MQNKWACRANLCHKCASNSAQVSEYNISGFARISEKVKSFMISAGLVAAVCEGFQKGLMEDSRIVY